MRFSNIITCIGNVFLHFEYIYTIINIIVIRMIPACRTQNFIQNLYKY